MKSPVELRRELHSNPELSGQEAGTARRILEFFQAIGPDATITDIGGQGLAFAFDGAEPGRVLMFRCELDALPIRETLDLEHRSRAEMVSHKCGHDGHMAILAEVGVRLGKVRPACGRVVLFFQPAEETGRGAGAAISDVRFVSVRPDRVFALHNVPGYRLGEVLVRDGVFCSASRGMIVRLSGRVAHAAQPENGVNPAAAMCRLIEGVQGLPESLHRSGEVAFATVVGARLGEKSFGTAAGHAEVYMTLRSESDETMARMIAHINGLVESVCTEESLGFAVEFEDVFDATVNGREAVDVIRDAATRCGLPLREVDAPFRWSEDFGRLIVETNGAMMGLGAGVDCPELHDPGYDFPDDLISIGAELLLEIVRQELG